MKASLHTNEFLGKCYPHLSCYTLKRHKENKMNFKMNFCIQNIFVEVLRGRKKLLTLTLKNWQSTVYLEVYLMSCFILFFQFQTFFAAFLLQIWIQLRYQTCVQRPSHVLLIQFYQFGWLKQYSGPRQYASVNVSVIQYTIFSCFQLFKSFLIIFICLVVFEN